MSHHACVRCEVVGVSCVITCVSCFRYKDVSGLQSEASVSRVASRSSVSDYVRNKLIIDLDVQCSSILFIGKECIQSSVDATT